MAMMEDSAPCSPAAFKMASSKGISAVTPSRENRFEPRYRACRTCSKRSARISRRWIIERIEAPAAAFRLGQMHEVGANGATVDATSLFGQLAGKTLKVRVLERIEAPAEKVDPH